MGGGNQKGKKMTKLKERELEDEYPVFPLYLYVADGKVIQSNIEGTVADLKRKFNAKTITNCDIGGRDLW